MMYDFFTIRSLSRPKCVPSVSVCDPREDRTGVCVAWPRQEMVIVITDSVASVDQDLVVVGARSTRIRHN